MIPLLLPPECCVWHGHVQSDATGSTRSIPGPSDAFIAWARTNGIDLSTLFLEQRPTQSKATGAPSHAFAVAYDIIGHFQTARDADLVMLCWGATAIDRG